jgi:hypothetical protein
MENKIKTADFLCKLLVIVMLIYVVVEMRSIKTQVLNNQLEVGFGNSKIDYVTSDINLHKNYENFR